MAFIDELLRRPVRSGRTRSEHPIRHVDKPHTCRHCERIVLNYEDLEGFEEELGVMILLPHTLAEARSAAADGCPLFVQLAKESRPPVRLAEIWYMLKECFVKSPPDRQHFIQAGLPQLRADPEIRDRFEIRLNIPSPLYTFSTDQSPLHLRTRVKILAYLLKHLRKRHLYLTFNVGRLHLFWLMRNEKTGVVIGEEVSFHHLITYSMAASPDDPAAEITPKRLHHTSVCSEANFTLVNEWLTECITSHPQCYSGVRYLPSRLLQISEDGETFKIRLVETDPKQKIAWCALSYVWGGDQPCKTTKASFEHMSRGMLVETLPRTLQDAVTVTRKLAIEFLWVDALCIIQDDPEDAAEQLRYIAHIYQNAVVTIFAGSAESVNEGFLQERGFLFNHMVPLSLRYKSSKGEIGQVTMLEPDVMVQQRDEFLDPIDRRGWTLQEQELTTRAVIYTRKGMLWKCRTICGDPDAPKRVSQAPSSDRTARQHPQISIQGGIPSRANEVWTNWRSIIEEYSCRELSQPLDKLVAISGLARAYASSGLTYVSGLWKEQLPQALCWATQNHNYSIKPTEYRAPSWSWASVDGQISWVAMENLAEWEPLAEVVEISITALPPYTCYDRISYGILTLKGRMAAARWYFNKGLAYIRDYELMAFPDVSHPEWPQGQEAWLDVWALLLVKERNPVQQMRDPPPPGATGFAVRGIFYPINPDGDWRGLLLLRHENDQYERVACFQPNAFEKAYKFHDVEEQVLQIV